MKDVTTKCKICSHTMQIAYVCMCCRNKLREHNNRKNLSEYKKRRVKKMISPEYANVGGSYIRKHCKACGKELTVFTDNHARLNRVSTRVSYVDYCSTRCKRSDNVVDRVCRGCGVGFPPYKNRQYCKECRK